MGDGDTDNSGIISIGYKDESDDPLKESSASAADFAANWVDMPGGATINNSVSGYVGSGAWRWIRLSGASELKATLSGYIFGAQYQGFTN